MTYILYSSRMSGGKKNTTANARKPLNCETHFWRHLFFFQSHSCAGSPRCSVVGRLRWGKWVGDAEGTVPSGEHFSPGEGWVPLSLSCLELHHLWKRQNKTNTTKQREVGVLRLSHLHALMWWKKGGTGAEFVQLLVPASQHSSASCSQVETLY